VQEQLERHIRAARDLLGYRGWDVSLWLTTDATVRRLNAQYRSKDTSTDILSFSYNEVRAHCTLCCLCDITVLLM
jgi:probable rRNA maturation factor